MELIKYYPVVLAMLIGLFLYTIARTFSPNYAVVASGLVLSGLWFQLHVSPQSLEILLYAGLLYLLVKIMDDQVHRKKWSGITLAMLPMFVMTHPETPLFLILGLLAFLFLKPIVSIEKKLAAVTNLRTIGGIIFVLLATILIWWSTIAYAVLATAETIVFSGIFQVLNHTSSSNAVLSLPTTPSASYQTVTNIQKFESVTVWLVGLGLLLFVRRFHARDYLFAGLFLAAILTIPVALLASPDVLQRSFLFALFPLSILLASLLAHPPVFRLSRGSITKLVGAGVIIMMICFAIVMPLARYGTDPFDYLPESSLAASNTAASLTSYSILFPSLGQYGWRYYSPSHGYYGGLLYEQNNITGRPGGFVKQNTYTEYNLTFTKADSTADYILISDYYQNLYVLRFGPYSTYFLGQKTNFETSVSENFNLVYTTGTDRIYENNNLA
jgi:hypothetical protein